MFKHPHFIEYIMARFVTITVIIFIFFSVLLFLLPKDYNLVLWAILLLALAFVVFIFEIYLGANRIQKELHTINNYLKNLKKTDQIERKTDFLTQEFDDIYENLEKVLKSAKKRATMKQRYNVKLKLKNRQRADMISAIAHEFRNPIASIMGYSQTLQDDPQISQSLREKFLGKIHNNGDKIEALLARLILWNKFESGEATLDKSTFDIVTALNEIKQSLEESHYKDRKIRIMGESRMVEADRTLMEVVFKNLIENALKYSKEEILVKIDKNSISVTDKGVGINSKDIDKVTKKFYRSGTHNWDNSMGLGLSIVKTILSLHQSKLSITSVENMGSTFSFKI